MPIIGNADSDMPSVAVATSRPAQFRVPALSSATRDYAHAVAGGTIDRLDSGQVARLFLAMGPEIWAWQRARRLTHQPPWRASPNLDDRAERLRAEQQMTDDVSTWERALIELDGDSRRARLLGRPPPLPLEIPAVVMAMIESRRAEALKKVSRRRTRTGDDGGVPAPRPDAAVDHPPVPTIKV